MFVLNWTVACIFTIVSPYIFLLHFASLPTILKHLQICNKCELMVSETAVVVVLAESRLALIKYPELTKARKSKTASESEMRLRPLIRIGCGLKTSPEVYDTPVNPSGLWNWCLLEFANLQVTSSPLLHVANEVHQDDFIISPPGKSRNNWARLSVTSSLF